MFTALKGSQLMTVHSGDRLRERAKALRLRPADLARELNESPQNINSWFKRGVPFAKMDKVATLLEWETEKLRYGTIKVSSPEPTQKMNLKDIKRPDYITTGNIPIVGNAQAGPDGYWDDLGQLEHGDGFIVASSRDLCITAAAGTELAGASSIGNVNIKRY